MTTGKKKRVQWTPGYVMAIYLGDGQYGFGMVLTPPVMAFYDLKSRTIPSIDKIISKPVLFRICVMKHAVREDWQFVGRTPVPPELLEPVVFFKQDPITKKLSLYRDDIQTEVPATLEECEGHECAAVWEPEHVVSRLNDHFAGRPNPIVEHLKPKPER